MSLQAHFRGWLLSTVGTIVRRIAIWIWSRLRGQEYPLPFQLIVVGTSQLCMIYAPNGMTPKEIYYQRLFYGCISLSDFYGTKNTDSTETEILPFFKFTSTLAILMVPGIHNEWSTGLAPKSVSKEETETTIRWKIACGLGCRLTPDAVTCALRLE